MNKLFHSPFSQQKGFTLIEVMVALAIIAIALSSLIKASGSHTRSASYLKSKTLAHYVALNEIAKIQVERKWPSLGTKSKSSEMAGVEWYWTTEVAKTRSDDIRSIRLTVYQDDRHSKNLSQTQAFIANPAITSAALNTGNSQTNSQNSSANGTGTNGTTN